MKKVKYGYISPIKYQHLIPEGADFHLILAHLLDNEEYVNFYKEKIKRGDTVILDNSAFEFKRALSAEEIFRFIDDSGIEPTYVVAPDYPFEHWEVTLESTLDFIERVRGEKDYKIMAVPQSEKGDVDGWIQCYRYMAANPDISVIGMSILGIPNAFCKMTGTEDISFNRIFATQYLLKYDVINQFKWHHYLGLGGGPREILAQRALGVMDSCDSSSPFWHGYLDTTFDNSIWGLKNGKSKIEVDFNAPYMESSVKTILKNINYMENIILK